MSIKKCFVAIGLLFAATVTTGCAAFQCENYMTYDETLDSWVGAELSAYEDRNELRALTAMERPRNRMEYEYDTPYYNYDGSVSYCRTYIEADKTTGEILRWRTEGDCFLHGRCQD